MIVVCPVCRPGPYGYAGTIVFKTCRACLRKIEQAR